MSPAPTLLATVHTPLPPPPAGHRPLPPPPSPAVGRLELRGLLSNRCLALLQGGRPAEALLDARRLVAEWPGWAKGQYRLGSALMAVDRSAREHYGVGCGVATGWLGGHL